MRVLHAQTEDDDLEVSKFSFKTRAGADVNQANQLEECDSIRSDDLIEAQMSKLEQKKKKTKKEKKTVFNTQNIKHI